MHALPSLLTEVVGTAGRLGGLALQMLQDRVELLALELREAKIRSLQLLLLLCLGMCCCMLGLLLLVVAGVLALPPEWRIVGLASAGGASLVAGGAFLWALRRRLTRAPMAFAQTMDELKKDAACFSIKT